MSRPHQDIQRALLDQVIGDPEDPQASGRDAWDKQRGESVRQYKWFLKYRDMGPSRSISKLAVEWAYSRSTLYHMCHNFRWVERTNLWDEWLDRQFIGKLTERRRDAIESHLDISQDMISKICDRLSTLKPESLGPTQLSMWFDLAVKVQRISLGLETLAKDGSIVVNQTVHNQTTNQTAIVASDAMQEKIRGYTEIFRRMEETERPDAGERDNGEHSPRLPLPDEGKFKEV